MYAAYFVQCNIAIALRKAGFDKSCMGAWSTQDNKLHVSYTTDPTDFHNIAVRRRNSEFPDYLYAAPLYQQVFDWLEAEGIYLHDYISPHFGQRHYGVNVFDNDNNCIWPYGRTMKNFVQTKDLYLHQDKRSAWEQAILAALEILQGNKILDELQLRHK